MLAPLRNRRFFSLAELNAAIATQVAWLNGRAFRGEVTSRRELFEELERKALKPLPTERFELADWKKVTVNIDYHVDFDERYYSVPYQLVRQPVEVRATATTVEVLKGGKRVASHAREHGRRRFVTTRPTCPPPTGPIWSGRRPGSSPGPGRSARPPPPWWRRSWPPGPIPSTATGPAWG